MKKIDLSRAHLYISGRVQGVFYRACTQEEAKGLGLKGWVKNLDDGRVEVVCEGVREDILKLIEWCRVGPPGAIVRDVKVDWEPPTGEFNEFRIIYGY